jgi:cell division protein FtsB
MRELSLELIGTRSEVRRRGGVIPSWVIFGMIILATSALCVTVSMRTHAQMQMASSQNVKIQRQVETLRGGNAALQSDIHRMRSDPRAIESAARSLNMVRPNETILPEE